MLISFKVTAIAAFGLVLANVPQAIAGTAWCLKTDMNGDRVRDPADVPVFIAALMDETIEPLVACAADINDDGAVDGQDIPAFIQILRAPDTDGDGIPDVFETNDGIVLGPTAIGTNPSDADTDDDAIRDGDEVFRTAAGLDLHPMGANPVRKDIFVEVDWFDDGTHTHRPNATVVSLLQAAFAAASTPNPYGASPGIAIHIDYGQGGAFTGGNLIPGSDTVVVFNTEFYDYKEAHFNPNRRDYFHYSIHCHRYNTETNNSSGVAELNGNDFIVAADQPLQQQRLQDLHARAGPQHRPAARRIRESQSQAELQLGHELPPPVPRGGQ